MCAHGRRAAAVCMVQPPLPLTLYSSSPLCLPYFCQNPFLSQKAGKLEVGLALVISLPFVGLTLGRSFSLSRPQCLYLYNELHHGLQTQKPKSWAGDIK